MAHEDQFTATGPAFTGSGFSRAGFSTNRAGADFEHGVNVEGSRCGVFGKSVQQARSSREADVEGVGVFGKGDNFGIFGQGNLGMAGVIGTHNNIHRPDNDGVGVVGAVIRGGTGVMGVSLQSLTAFVGQKEIPDSADGNGVGVFGSSGSGAGVRGTSIDGAGGEFESSTRSGVFGVSDSGIGVEGRSREVAGVYGTSIDGAGGEFISDTKTGVFGESDSGIGVEGRSRQDRGAVFESGKNVAQIRLVPQMQRTRFPKLPKEGKVGDLILTRYRTVRIADEPPTDTCSLWLCVPKDSSSDDSDQWREVMLGPVVTGTI